MPWIPKDSKKADMDLYPYRLFSIAPPLAVVNKCALASKQKSLHLCKGRWQPQADGGVVNAYDIQSLSRFATAPFTQGSLWW